MKKRIAVNERGLRVGEDHHNAKLTDHEVELLLTLHDDGVGYKRLGEIFGISKSGARMICKGRRRCQTPAKFKSAEVHVPGE